MQRENSGEGGDGWCVLSLPGKEGPSCEGLCPSPEKIDVFCENYPIWCMFGAFSALAKILHTKHEDIHRCICLDTPLLLSFVALHDSEQTITTPKINVIFWTQWH